MLRLVFFLAVSCALAWAAVWVVNHPGTVAIQWLDREVILNVGTTIALVLVFAAVVIILFELLRWLLGLPSRWRYSRGHRREMRGYEELTRGLMAAAAGDLAAARGHHRQAERYLPDSGGLLLLSAQTAQLEGKEEVAHLKFRQMLERRDAEFVGLRGLLAQSMKIGEFDEALTLARRAYRRSPTTPWVLTTLFELLARAEKWDEALPLVGEMQAQNLLDDAQAKHKRAVVHHMLATRLRQQDRLDDALAQARKAEKAAPDFVPAAVQAAELAQQLGRRRLALKLVETAWQAQPHPDLARVYAQLEPNETPEKRLQRIDTRLASLAKSDPETLVLQAELAMQAQQWDTARMRLDAAGSSARVYRLRAELERQSTGDNAKVQDWLTKASEAEPDRCWVCEDTGEVLPAWQPFAPSGRFDAVQWAAPPRIATMVNANETTYILAGSGPAPTSGMAPAAAVG